MDTTSGSATQAILGYTMDELQHRALEDIGTRLPMGFVATLSEIDTMDALRASLMVHHLSSHAIFPRDFQLQASLAILHGKDSIVTAGTGSGKTLCQLIPLLLPPGTLLITISPLNGFKSLRYDILQCADVVPGVMIAVQSPGTRI